MWDAWILLQKVTAKILLLLVRIGTPSPSCVCQTLLSITGYYWFVKIWLTEGWLLFWGLLAGGPSSYLFSAVGCLVSFGSSSRSWISELVCEHTDWQFSFSCLLAEDIAVIELSAPQKNAAEKCFGGFFQCSGQVFEFWINWKINSAWLSLKSISIAVRPHFWGQGLHQQHPP